LNLFCMAGVDTKPYAEITKAQRTRRKTLAYETRR